MKHLPNFTLVMILILSCAVRLIAQDNPNPGYIFNNRDDLFTGCPDSGIRPYAWNNGIVYLGFDTDNNMNVWGMTLTFYDTLGNLVWKRNIYDAANPEIQGNDIIAFNEYSFYVTGILYHDSIHQFDMFLGKYDQNGHCLLWMVYPDTASKFPMSMELIAPDTLLVLSGWNIVYGDEFCKISLDKVDTNGIICQSYLGPLDTYYPDQVLLTNQNLIYVGGTRKTQPGWDYYVKVFINKYDLNLNYLGTINPGYSINEYFEGMINVGDNILMSSTVTTNCPSGYPCWQCLVTKLTPSGGTWGGERLGPAYMDMASGRPVLVDSDLVAITVFGDITETYFTDTIPEKVCSTSFAYPGFFTDVPWLSDICSVPGHKIAGTGYIFPQNAGESQDTWNFLSKNMSAYVDSVCLHVGIPYESGLSMDTWKVYPVPFSDNLFIENKTSTPEKTIVYLFNSTGELVFRGIFEREMEIYASSFQSGLYLLKLDCATRSEVYKIVKQ
jgi:hypothetical protein